MKLSKLGNPKTVYYGTESISVLGPKLWIILTDEYKNLTSLKESQGEELGVSKLPMTFIQDMH